MEQSELRKFTNLYPVSKTLRFELKPIGKTEEWIEKNGLLEQDNHRAESYKSAKKLIDFYHKHYIDSHLRDFRESVRSNDILGEKVYVSLETCAALMGKTDEAMKKKLNSAQDLLRKEIAKTLAKDKKDLFSEKLIKEDLMNYLYEAAMDGEVLPDKMTIDECKSIVEEFQSFTTYFTGFNQNRENMYSEEAKATSIAFRLVHENLPKFTANMQSFKKIAEPLKENIAQLEKDLAFVLQGKTISYFFESTAAYLDCLTQSDIAAYNAILGGRSEKQGQRKIQGLNEYVNLYNQQHKGQRLPKFVELYKMILSDRESLSWLPEQFENDQNLLETIEQTYQSLNSLFCDDAEVHPSLKNLLLDITTYDPKGIFIANDLSLTGILKTYYGNWDVLRRALETQFENSNPRKNGETAEKYEDRRDKYVKSFESFSLDDINHYVGDEKHIEDYFVSLGSTDKEPKTLFEKAIEAYEDAKDILNTTPTAKLTSDNCVKQVEKIKNLLDALKDIQHFVQPLQGKGNEVGRDTRFYADYEKLWSELDQITPLYNKVRNYLTQRPYSEEKFKLNFENPVLLNGWPNVQANSGAIFRMNKNCYYLAILDSKFRTILNDIIPPKGDNDRIELMNYLQGGDMGKNVQNLMKVNGKTKKVNGRKEKDGEHVGENLRLEEAKNSYLPNEINEIRKKGSYSKASSSFCKEDLSKFIEFYIPLVREYYSDYDFNFRNPDEYDTFVDFTNHINEQAYQISFQDYSLSELQSLVDQGKLYLFQIYNKDFSEYSKGTPNMHTLYWKMLFDEENLKNVVYKLNGQAEVFFRKKSVTYDEKHQKEGFHHNELKDKFKYPIFKDRRYSVDKFQFHVPITMNFKGTSGEMINQKVNEFIKGGGIEHIIGIDRGERHLLYLSLIDLKGNIVKQFTLNEIVNEYRDRATNEIKTKTTDYHKLLDIKEKERDEARKSWKTVENIKELKEGYLSQVVHIIAQMMVEYKAIVVLENLNGGFMNGRKKVEKQVYEKFEKALIDKLNYLVDKKKPANQEGGLLHAYQLATEAKTFAKYSSNQCGFIFYIPAWNTSKIDPVTGFANYIDTKYKNVEQARMLLGKFADIQYNSEKDYFEFLIDDYSKFNAKAEGTRLNWTLCTYGDRIRAFRNSEKNGEWDNEKINLTQYFKDFFNSENIDYHNNLIAQILMKDSKTFFDGMLYRLSLTLQMRNSKTGSSSLEDDFIISPVADGNGNFYDSRIYAGIENAPLPKDADANGAYNIARKGLWAVMQMQQADDPSDVKLAMSNEEWMRFAQEKPYRK